MPSDSFVEYPQRFIHRESGLVFPKFLILLRIKISAGGYSKPVRFLLDSGSDFTTISAAAADKIGMPMESIGGGQASGTSGRREQGVFSRVSFCFYKFPHQPFDSEWFIRKKSILSSSLASGGKAEEISLLSFRDILDNFDICTEESDSSGYGRRRLKFKLRNDR